MQSTGPTPDQTPPRTRRQRPAAPAPPPSSTQAQLDAAVRHALAEQQDRLEAFIAQGMATRPAEMEEAAQRAVRHVLSTRQTPEAIGRQLDTRITTLVGVLLKVFSRRLNVALILLFELMFLVNVSILQRFGYVPTQWLNVLSLGSIVLFLGCVGLMLFDVAQTLRATH